jgi:hypothetical protein
VNFPCTTVSFTVSPEPKGFVMLCPLALGISAFYDISVRMPPAVCANGSQVCRWLPPNPFSRRRLCLKLGVFVTLTKGQKNRLFSSIWTLALLQGTSTPLVHARAGRTHFSQPERRTPVFRVAQAALHGVRLLQPLGLTVNWSV